MDPTTQQKSPLFPILLSFLIGILFTTSILFAYQHFRSKEPVARGCSMEAKICPDGTSVGRSGPNCEFATCPASSTEGKFCGGIAANLPQNQCPEGYKCKIDGKYPDAGGTCIKLSEKSE